MLLKVKSAHSIFTTSYAKMVAEKEVQRMKRKYYLALATAEWRLIIGSLNNLGSRFIAGGKYTDAVDELLIKFSGTKVKNSRRFTQKNRRYRQ